MNDINNIFSNIGNYLANNTYVLVIYSIINVALKGIALWKSARNSHKYWFVFILFVNLLTIPELLYIFYFSKHDIKMPSLSFFTKKDSAPVLKSQKNKISKK